MTVTVYTLSDCIQCEMTMKQLDRYKIEYEIKSFEDDPNKAQEFVERGYKNAPVVVTEHKTWSGFQYEELKHLAMTQGKSLI